MYSSECKDCQVDFLSKQIGHKLESPWRIFYCTFKFQDDIYHALTIDFDMPETVVWLNNNINPMEQIPIHIPQTFPDVKPETALSLARRLHKLIAFT